ncbi:hypothetical protein C4K03_0218 [Pseudomonas synxantha]|uniref:Dermonecrotic toxin N-terminal domain-containing protein n=1 Tax=Pseudomonas synxantha TaxID=47883 RepID=A0A3G7U1N1_9PSED|nr:DUF6543 domain-containing protein [Pseudomonas synxantha]AZE52406.1 hypothetical protein C4K03_0218 [Pseudomonas synxantha]
MSIRFPVQLVSTFVEPKVVVEKPEEKPPVEEVPTYQSPNLRHPSACKPPSLADYQKKNSLSQGAASGGMPIGSSNQRSALKKNTHIETYISKHSSDFISPEKEISAILSAKIKQHWGVDVDPDKTYLVTFKHEGEDEKEVVEKITLTQAALKNRQDVTVEDNEGWFVKIAKYFSPAVYIYNKVDGWVREANSRQGIYREPSTPDGASYNADTRVSIPVDDFKALVWDTDRTQLYKKTLDGFWDKHTASYAALSKISFVKAINLQRLEGTLGPVETALAQRALGPVAQKEWSELTVDDFATPAVKDPDLDIGLLSINGLQSTDLMCVTDRKTQLTLLYIPGNSSPIHRFDNPAHMKTWLAKQAADPVKRESLLTHFSLKDQANKSFSDGVRQSLEGMGSWSDAQTSGGSILAKLNGWVPDRFITVDRLHGDPFEAAKVRQKARSYSDAENAIVSDGDYTKNKIFQGVEEATKVAMFMTPLALVMPEVAIGLDVFFLAAGATQAGIGIDDAVKGKATASDRIVFGVLNAVPPLATHAGAPVAKALTERVTSEGVAAGVDVAAQAPAQAAEQARPIFNPPGRVNGQIGYPMGPVSPPKILEEITIPMDDVHQMFSKDYMVFVGQYGTKVTYDVEARLWRGVNENGEANDVFYWRKGQGKWLGGTKTEAIEGSKRAPVSSLSKTLKLPRLPSLPSGATEVPKVIHYFWAGNEMPEHLLDNIIENARKSPGYKSVVHVDANDASAFQKIKSALDHKVGGLEVHDLKEDEAFQALNASKYAEMYQYFRSGQGQNLSASSDVMRVALMKKYGGIYLDTDDTLAFNVGDITLKATPNDILMNSPVTYEPTDFKGFNTSNFASHPDNPLFDKILEESYQRYKANESWLATHRPFFDEGLGDAEQQAYKEYETRIFEITGPRMFGDVLEQEKYGFFPVVDDITELLGARILLPDDYAKKLIQVRDFYMPMNLKFGVTIGAEHSMYHSR